jgi:competence protein ComEA
LRPPEPDRRQQRARERLVAIRGPDRVPPDVDYPAVGQPVDHPAVDQPDAVDRFPAVGGPVDGVVEDLADDPEPAPSREGRLVRRWVPAPLRGARWDPGRPGAVMLSLVAALAAIIAAVGVWRDRPLPVPAPQLPLVAAPSEASQSLAPSTAETRVVISVVGRVARPGLLRLPDGSRVADALDAAGGPLPDTDLAALNLARKLSDGEQLLVGVPPPAGQAADGVASSGGSQPPSGTSSVLDLNTATLQQLDTLPGVGPVMAQRILDWRAAHGRFQSVNQLREVSGIGEARFTQLKELVRV